MPEIDPTKFTIVHVTDEDAEKPPGERDFRILAEADEYREAVAKNSAFVELVERGEIVTKWPPKRRR